MAGQGFKDFSVGEVLTSADVDGYLMQQSVMRFASSAARGSALGTATGTAVPLAEGMVSYLDDGNITQVYSGSQWVGLGNYNAQTTITATNASWPVPTLANPIVRVTIVAGGGGGAGNIGAGGAGGNTSFGSYGTATGGAGGQQRLVTAAGVAGTPGFSAGNGGGGIQIDNVGSANETSNPGRGGSIIVRYVDLTGVSTVNVTIGAGGAAGSGTPAGGAGGRGEVIVEYLAG